MTIEINGMKLQKIGIVRNEMKETGMNDCSEIVSEIVLNKELNDALDCIDEFSHIIVLYWMHIDHWPGEKPLKNRPRHDPDNPLVGIFATRSPDRPNRIGMSTAKVIERMDNSLIVKGLDAVEGTSVLDIKPYLPRADSVQDAKLSSWELKQG